VLNNIAQYSVQHKMYCTISLVPQHFYHLYQVPVTGILIISLIVLPAGALLFFRVLYRTYIKLKYKYGNASRNDRSLFC
jgi:hypothetical protein